MYQTVRWGTEPQFYRAAVAPPTPPQFLMLHANGFNGGTYIPLLERLAPAGSWAAPDFRGHGGSFQPKTIRWWFDFVEDVFAWQAWGHIPQPIALGHSLGGITALLAEARRPGTFRAIVLLDPIAFHPRALPMLWMVQLPGVRAYHPMVRAARRRRAFFPNRQAILQSYATKPVFQRWQRPFLDAYVDWGTLPAVEGLRLACDPTTEARIFSSWPMRFWLHVPSVHCPVLILRGQQSEPFTSQTARLLARRLPSASLVEVPSAGHFLPMEQPDACVRCIHAFLKEKNLI